jgi:GTP-binding protein
VGKSTLFNRLVGKKLALVDDQPGVTRDRRFGEAGLLGLEFQAVDTAGWEDEEAETLPGRMRAADRSLAQGRRRGAVRDRRARRADPARRGDRPLAARAGGAGGADRQQGRGQRGQSGILEAYSLGLGEPVPVSAEHGEGIADLYEALVPLYRHLQPTRRTAEAREDDEEEDPRTRRCSLAIVGRPERGKSTLINRMLGEDRLLTGPEAGITRDSIAVPWQWTDPASGEVRAIKLIDTAGMRKKAKVDDKLERLAVADARRAVDFAEVVVLLLDATRGLEVQDLKIANLVLEEGRALMIAINKWDVAENASGLFNGIRAALDEGLAQLKGVPLLAGLGADRQGARPADSRGVRAARAVEPARADRGAQPLVRQGDGSQSPACPGGRRIKLRYVTQIKTRPPSFVVFGTRLDDLPASYERYLVNSIRKDLDFGASAGAADLAQPEEPVRERVSGAISPSLRRGGP